MDAGFPRSFSTQYLGDEAHLVRAAADRARLPAARAAQVGALATALIGDIRANRRARSGLDAFLVEYSLSSREGVLLLCLAESLLRIPDAATADRLIAEKIRAGDWASHAGDSGSLFVNASTWSLMLTGRILRGEEQPQGEAASLVQRLMARVGEPVVRAALGQALRILGTQFVLGRDMAAALRRARDPEHRGYRFSFDMLGEAALTWADADRYLDAYGDAIDAIAAGEPGLPDASRSSISVKLSALHPRYESQRAPAVLAEILPRVLQLARRAAAAAVPLTLDAEEAERLELQLAVTRAVMESPELEGWTGFGIALQAYQRRAPAVLDWLLAMATHCVRRLAIRLVKGAYWDTEIKRAQERGLASYPVYTRKCNTDVAWLACARRLLDADPALIAPQFATHNAHSVAYVLTLAGAAGRKVEFQRLHGMGRELYDGLVQGGAPRAACRIYAPVGSHAQLLPYLVRRLLENGANASFVHRLVDERQPIAELARDPVEVVDRLERVAHPAIADPPALFGAERVNSAGFNFADSAAYAALLAGVAQSGAPRHHAAAIIAAPDGSSREAVGPATPVFNPARRDDQVGSVTAAGEAEARRALNAAADSFAAWEATPAEQRAACLRRAADLFESRRVELMTLAVREAGKTWPNAVDEVREAVDFLRYYAARAQLQFGSPLSLPGPTGEQNELWLRGRGPFVCISPWNFPLSIFTGQVAAALAAGNSVIAKPAEQTPLIAARAVQLLHDAGVPRAVLSFLPGDGAALGHVLLDDPRVAGVAFTGSTGVATAINRQLAAREGPLAVLIAETGGQNVMIADSSALAEQVVVDVVRSAFDSAGQRCSAARVLALQDDVADHTINLLRGYMDTLQVGDPSLPATDVGPVIDSDARRALELHVAALAPRARWLHRAPLRDGLERQGHFLAPVALEIDSLGLLEREVFGPVLHVVRYRASELDALIDAVNALGYGLTLGVHSRLDSTAQHIAGRARVGNVYVNRNIIGAVVGVQPFGGRGLSGTGPKAGGPHYLPRFATERTVTTNTAAVGGNASLLALGQSNANPEIIVPRTSPE